MYVMHVIIYLYDQISYLEYIKLTKRSCLSDHVGY